MDFSGNKESEKQSDNQTDVDKKTTQTTCTTWTKRAANPCTNPCFRYIDEVCTDPGSSVLCQLEFLTTDLTASDMKNEAVLHNEVLISSIDPLLYVTRASRCFIMLFYLSCLLVGAFRRMTGSLSATHDAFMPQ